MKVPCLIRFATHTMTNFLTRQNSLLIAYPIILVFLLSFFGIYLFAIKSCSILGDSTASRATRILHV